MGNMFSGNRGRTRLETDEVPSIRIGPYRLVEDDSIVVEGQRIELDRNPRHYGGAERYFRCPDCGHRRRRLFRVEGRYACSRCHKIQYPCQRERGANHALRRFLTIKERLGSKPGLLSPCPPKPRYRHHATQRRLVLQLLDAAAAACRAYDARNEGLDKLLARMEPVAPEER